MKLPLSEIRKSERGAGLEGRDQEFRCRHNGFKIPIRHLNGNTEHAGLEKSLD